MPIRRIVVDWGDLTPPAIVGNGKVDSFKARWPHCDNSDFAHSPDGCDESPFNFSHVYFCAANNSLGLQLCPTGAAAAQATNCWNGTACVFIPKVQILDNWGWCNGTCEGGNAAMIGKTGCYDAEWAGRPNECKVEKPGPWTPFSGQIIVIPPA